MSNELTPGDLLFRRFIDRLEGYKTEYEPDLTAALGLDKPIETNPDFLISWSGGRAVCEVKSFEETAFHRRMSTQRVGTGGSRDMYGPIRQALRTAARQLRPLQGAGVPLVTVLTNPRNIFIDLDPFIVQGAILGDRQVVIPISKEGGSVGEGYDQAGRDGVMLRERRYVSAVVVVHSEEAADIYETAGAEAVPLPPDVFRGVRVRRHGYLSETTYGELPPDE